MVLVMALSHTWVTIVGSNYSPSPSPFPPNPGREWISEREGASTLMTPAVPGGLYFQTHCVPSFCMPQSHTRPVESSVLSSVLGVEVTKKITLIPTGRSHVSPRKDSGASGMELGCGTMNLGKEIRIFDA